MRFYVGDWSILLSQKVIIIGIKWNPLTLADRNIIKVMIQNIRKHVWSTYLLYALCLRSWNTFVEKEIPLVLAFPRQIFIFIK